MHRPDPRPFSARIGADGHSGSPIQYRLVATDTRSTPLALPVGGLAGVRRCRSAQRADRSDGDPAPSAVAAAAARLPGADGADRRPADAGGVRSGRRTRCYAICLAPPGASLLGRSRPWPEAELLECVLRPVAHVLEHLQCARHDASRHPARQRVPEPRRVSRSCWAPPGPRRRRWRSRRCSSRPIRRCACRPAAATAASPTMSMRSACCCCAWRSAARRWRSSTMRRSCAASWSWGPTPRWPATSGCRRSSAIWCAACWPRTRSIGRPPTLLLDPASARGRRVAARPPRRAQRSIAIAGGEIWDARSLAHAHGDASPTRGCTRCAANVVEHWLRRGLGDAQLATRVEELVRHRSLDGLPDDGDGEATLVMRAIAVLDPLAPLCWRGMALWPDGIGPALAAAQGNDPDVVARLEEIIAREEAGNWAAMRADRCDFAVLRVEARQQHVGCSSAARAAGCRGLTYLLNPLMPCASPLMGGRWVARLSDLLPALEKTAGQVDHKQTEPIDPHVAAFISARLERRLDNELSAQSGGGDAGARLPGAASRAGAIAVAIPSAAAAGTGGVAGGAGRRRCWRPGSNRERRAAVAERLRALVAGGLSGADAGGARGSGRRAARMRARRSEAAAEIGADRRGTGADRRGCARAGRRRRRAWVRRSPPASGWPRWPPCSRSRRWAEARRWRSARPPTQRRQPPRKPRQHSLVWLQGLLCGAMVTLATPTALLLGVLLGPALLATAAGSRAGAADGRAASRCAAWRRRSIRCGRCGRPATAWRRPPRCWAISQIVGDRLERRGRRLAAGRGDARSRFARSLEALAHRARRPAARRAGQAGGGVGTRSRPRTISDRR